MDPLTAIGLTSNVISLIQSGLQVVVEAKDIYQSTSGISQRNESLEQQSLHLNGACTDLRTCIGRESDPTRLSNAEVALRDLAWKCIEAGARLRDLIQRVKAGPRKRDALFKTLKSRWKQDEIDLLRKEVEGYQNALNTRILIDLKLDLQKRQLQMEKAAGEGFDALINALKDSLLFPAMNHRKEQIQDAHSDTFHWIFDDCPTAEDQWDCFGCWLRNDKGLYWINGKAGSGKSTIMNYISHDSEMNKGLKRWSGQDDTVVAKFFFWNSGTALERSLEGLFRTLLWQILDQSPQTAGVLFPSLRPAELASLNHEESRGAYWTEQKLINAFNRLAGTTSQNQHFCLFIDGLDEFAGSKATLIDVLDKLANSPHIKICASSRPVHEFMEAFDHDEGLRLERLTAKDIKTYVDKTIRQNPAGALLSEKEEKEFKYLVDDVSDKAAGVFLWVRLVVSKLIADIRNGDSIESLRKRLNDLPSDLNDLFKRMISNLEPSRQAEAASWFRFLFAAPDHDQIGSRYSPAISILDLLFAKDVTQSSSLLHPNSKADWQALKGDISAFRQRIETICCGLVEFIDLSSKDRDVWTDKLSPDAIPFLSIVPRLLHRSVKEYLQEQTTIQDFPCQPTQPDYDKLLMARLITTKTLLIPNLEHETIHNLADYFLILAHHVEETALITNTALIDELDRCCMACARQSGLASWMYPKHIHSEQISHAIKQVGVDDTGKDDVFAKIDVSDVDIVAYAAAFGLLLYVKKKVMDNPPLCQRSDKLPILHAIHCVDRTDRGEAFGNPAWQSLLEFLLQNQADPNLKFKGKSAWRLRLDAQGAEEMSPSSFTRLPPEFSTFLDYGADPNQVMNYGSVLCSSRVYKRNGDTIDDSDLFSAIETFRAAKKTQEEEGESDIGSIFDIIADVLMMCLSNEDLFTTAKTDTEGSTDEQTGITELKPSPKVFLVRPQFRISLLHWVTHAVIETTESQAFRDRLISLGATVQKPFIFRMPSSVPDLEHLGLTFNNSCNWRESEMLTDAWYKHFPNYTVTVFPAMINTLIEILRDGGFVRSPGPLTSDEVLQTVNIIHETVCGGGLLPKFPTITELFRMFERLRDIDIIPPEGLLRIHRLWRTGRVFVEQGLIKIPKRIGPEQPLLATDVMPRNADGSVDTEKAFQLMQQLRNEGLCDDEDQPNEESGLIFKDGGPPPFEKLQELQGLIEGNGIGLDTTSMLKSMRGGMEACPVM